MRRRIGFRVDVNLVPLGQPYAELPFDGLPRPRDQAFAKVGVIAGPRREAVLEVGRRLHAICLRTSSLNTPSTSTSSSKEPLCTTLPAWST